MKNHDSGKTKKLCLAAMSALLFTIFLTPAICSAEISEFDSFAYDTRYDSDGYVLTRYDSPQTYFIMKDREDKEVRIWRKVGGGVLLLLAGWGFKQKSDFGATSGCIFMFSGFIRVLE